MACWLRLRAQIKMKDDEALPATAPEEVARVLDAVLRVVRACTAAEGEGEGQRRRVFFSSFDPDAVLELKRRNVPQPVYFLSGCGLYPHCDARRTSIPSALEFASKNAMQGVVMPASVFIANTGMMAEARVRARRGPACTPHTHEPLYFLFLDKSCTFYGWIDPRLKWNPCQTGPTPAAQVPVDTVRILSSCWHRFSLARDTVTGCPVPAGMHCAERPAALWSPACTAGAWAGAHDVRARE